MRLCPKILRLLRRPLLLNHHHHLCQTIYSVVDGKFVIITPEVKVISQSGGILRGFVLRDLRADHVVDDMQSLMELIQVHKVAKICSIRAPALSSPQKYAMR